MATTFAEAREIAATIGYPVLVRPSYVLGGRGMEIVYDDATLEAYIAKATDVSAAHPVLVDRFLEDAVEIDVDALYDGTDLYLGGVMEHIEEAGIHSGDSACALPPITLGSADLLKIRAATEKLAARIGVRGLMNVQYAIKDDILYVIEANPRASRTVPFVSKATAVQLAKAAARIAVGETIADLRTAGVLPATGDGTDLPENAPIAVKEAVLPFHRFRTVEGHGVDTVLSPEMKSTGEVMGLDSEFGRAFAKSQAAAYGSLPTEGTVFVSLANRDKRSAIFPIKRLADLGFRVLATVGHRPGAAAQRGALRGGRQVQRRARQRGGADPGRRRRHRGQHALRLAGQQRARASTATRSAPPPSPPASRASPPCRAWPPPCRASRRCAGATSASAACRRSTPRWRPRGTRSDATC